MGEIQNPLQYAKDLLEQPVQRNDGYSYSRLHSALMALVRKCEDSGDELWKTDTAISAVIQNANENRHKLPNALTLLEEVAEAILAARGKHDDPLRLELTQIAGICINLIRRMDYGDVISLKTDDIKNNA